MSVPSTFITAGNGVRQGVKESKYPYNGYDKRILFN